MIAMLLDNTHSPRDGREQAEPQVSKKLSRLHRTQLTVRRDERNLDKGNSGGARRSDTDNGNEKVPYLRVRR